MSDSVDLLKEVRRSYSNRTSIDAVVDAIHCADYWEMDTSGITEGFPPVINIYHEDKTYSVLVVTEVKNAHDYANGQRRHAERAKEEAERYARQQNNRQPPDYREEKRLINRAKEAELRRDRRLQTLAPISEDARENHLRHFRGQDFRPTTQSPDYSPSAYSAVIILTGFLMVIDSGRLDHYPDKQRLTPTEIQEHVRFAGGPKIDVYDIWMLLKQICHGPITLHPGSVDGGIQTKGFIELRKFFYEFRQKLTTLPHPAVDRLTNKG